MNVDYKTLYEAQLSMEKELLVEIGSKDRQLQAARTQLRVFRSALAEQGDKVPLNPTRGMFEHVGG